MKKIILGVLLFCFLPVGLFQSSTANSEEKSKIVYFCPMHPHVHSFEQGICPICGMRLEKMPDKTNAPLNFDRNATVPGRKSIYIDDMQFQLSGAALVSVLKKDLTIRIPASGKALSKKNVVLYFAERDLSFVAVGHRVKIHAPMLGEKAGSLLGKISGLDALLDPMTKTLRAEVELSFPVEELKPEASIFAEMERTKKGVLAIPREAVLSFGDYAYVFLLDQKTKVLSPQKITLGLKGEAFNEVTSGLVENQVISAGPNFLIDSESRIQVGRGQ